MSIPKTNGRFLQCFAACDGGIGRYSQRLLSEAASVPPYPITCLESRPSALSEGCQRVKGRLRLVRAKTSGRGDARFAGRRAVAAPKKSARHNSSGWQCVFLQTAALASAPTRRHANDGPGLATTHLPRHVMAGTIRTMATFAKSWRRK